MKTNFLPAVKLTLLFMLFFMGVYSLGILAIAQLAPNHARGFMIDDNGKKYYENIAQNFFDDKYFWSRPSAVNYNAAGSGGSNKGPSNPEYLATVQARIDTFLVHNPGVKKQEIPSDLVTASGSGQDPHISPEGAKVQVIRVAKKRSLPEAKVMSLVNEYTEKPWLGLFGPSRVNVLKLNIALDNLKN